MVREKLVSTFVVATAVIVVAMGVDFVITILILHDWVAYTPVITLAIASVVTYPVTYGLVSSRINLRIARDELTKARDAAVEASRAKSAFLANMSHELRTPLNAIIGFSGMLESDLFAARSREYAGLIHGAGTHLLGLVNDLLDLSRIEASKLDLYDETIDIGALVNECGDVVEKGAAEHGLTLLRHVQAGLPCVRADRRALKQIVLNLLSNAIKFSGSGQKIQLAAHIGSDGGLLLVVEDEGTGIAEDEQAFIFERFGRSRHDIARNTEGTGLGLAIVKGLAEGHGGRVALTSKLGEGTCVSVWLPPDRLIGHTRAAA